MKFAIIVSTKDLAGMNIKEKLLKKGFIKIDEKFENHFIYELNDLKLYTTDKDTIFCEHIDKKINADFFIFATKHQSTSNIPSLSCHVPGNFGKADFGGEDKKLCFAFAGYLKSAYKTLNKNNLISFDVVMEVTHHGPYLDKPCMFIEIGSTEKQWVRDDAGEIVAKTIIEFLGIKLGKYKTAFGVGGLHTCTNFKKILLETDVSLGHMCPKYMFDFVDEDIFKQAINNHVEKVDFVILDWKGLGQHKEKIVRILDSIDIEVKRIKDF